MSRPAFGYEQVDGAFNQQRSAFRSRNVLNCHRDPGNAGRANPALDRLAAFTVGGLLAGATSLVPIQSGGVSELAAHSRHSPAGRNGWIGSASHCRDPNPLDRLAAFTVGGLLAGATSLVPIQQAA